MEGRKTDSVQRRSSPRQLLAVLVVAGILMAAKGGYQWYSISGVADWDTVFGQIIISKPRPPRGAQIIYQYQHPRYKNLQPVSCSVMPNQTSKEIDSSLGYRRDRLRICKNQYIQLANMNAADALLARFPKGEGVQIYVSKKGSYLIAEPQQETWYYWVLGGMLLAVLGMGLLKLTAPPPSANEKVPSESAGLPPRQ